MQTDSDHFIRATIAMKKKVAIVEDNPDNRLLIQAMLEDVYEIIEYETGLEAIDGFKDEIPDLVLLDISLPEMDGTEVLKHIRADATLQHLPVVALTAHAMAGDREHFLAVGFNDYVAKPIADMDILLRTVAGLLT